MRKEMLNQWFGKLLLLALSAGLFACASVLPGLGSKPDEQLMQTALSGEPLLGRPFDEAELPSVDLMALTPEMKAFAERHTAGIKSGFARAKALHRALLGPTTEGGHGITYTAFYTLSAADAFEQRQANCLSFTLLYVSMARHVGLSAQVNEVDLPPTWDLRNQDAFLFLRHVNAKVSLRRDEVVIDLEMDRYNTNYDQRLISETLAAAQYYNNRGMELSAEGEIKQAFLYLRKALLLDDQQSYIWNNMATVYRRNGFMDEAEALYMHGLRLDDRDLSIISNLSGLYRQMGQDEKADEFFQRAERHRSINPYYMYYEALKYFEAGDAAKAQTLIVRAIRKEDTEVRFYELAEKVYKALGDERRAEIMRQRAETQRKARLLQS